MEEASKKLNALGSCPSKRHGYSVPSGSRMPPCGVPAGMKYGISSVPGRTEYIVLGSSWAADERWKPQ